MNDRLAGRAVLLLSAFFALAMSNSVAQEKPSTPIETSDFCGRSSVKKIILDALNSSVGFKERKITLLDFQEVKTLSTDVANNSFSCHGVMLLSDGQKFAGILTLAANGNKTDIDWFDDDSAKGLAQFSGAASSMPPDEAQFIRTLVLARSNYESATTDFLKGATRPQRAKAICAILKSAQANNWIGKISRLTTNGDGKGVVAVEIAPDVSIKTFSIELADIGSNTLVDPDSQLFAALGQLSPGDQVRFSGSFIAERTDCIKETSMRMRGSLTSPEFVMKFVDVQRTSY
jgi:hypothetical protein